RQERELRRWLYGSGVGAAVTLADGLADAAADVEDLYGVRIELATAGDVRLDESLEPLVLAAREAMTNAAKFSAADEVSVYRAGARGALAAAGETAGEAGSVADAVPLIRELDPDVVLLDVHLPDGGGEGVIAAVAPERPGVKFLALSVSDAAEDVIGVIRAGARGYVTKTISSEELTDAVRRVADGDAVFSPRL